MCILVDVHGMQYSNVLNLVFGKCKQVNYSLRTDTQLRFSLHFIPLGLSFCILVSQPVMFPVFGNYSSDIIKPMVKKITFVGLFKTFVV